MSQTQFEAVPLPRDLWGSYTATSLNPDPYGRGDSPSQWLRPLQRLNLLVGPNNSGKSRLLVHLFKELFSADSWHIPEDYTYEIHAKQFCDCASAISATLDLAGQHHFRSPGRVAFENIRGIGRSVEDDSRWASKLLGPNFDQTWPSLQSHSETLQTSIRGDSDYRKRLLEGSDRLKKVYRELCQGTPKHFPVRQVHLVLVPQTRGVPPRHQPTSSTAIVRGEPFELKPPTTTEQLTVHRSVFTGSNLYAHIRASLLGDLAQRERVKDFEKFLSKRFFRGRKVALIPREDKNGNPETLYLKEGREKERPLHELGDGIQQILILAFPIFEYRDQHLILFVDEPESSLHPGLQRVFAECCLDEPTGENGARQVIACTHSNHLLDLTIDRRRTSIFRLQKSIPTAEPEAKEVEPKFTVEVFDGESDDYELLRDLGAQNTSMLLSNCAIWVEGVSDRNYYRRFLQLLKEEQERTWLTEDTHYSFVEYGGSNITHWSFLDPHGPKAERITSRMMIICDGDMGKKDVRHQKLCDALGKEQVLVLDCKEVENLLTPSVLVNTVAELEGQGEHLNRNFNHTYSKRNMGKFIDSAIFKNAESQRRGAKGAPYRYGDEHGTLKDKRRFSEMACKQIQSIADLSDEALAVAERVLDFIIRYNPENGPAEPE